MYVIVKMAAIQEEMIRKVEAPGNKLEEKIKISNKTFDDKIQVLNRKLKEEMKGALAKNNHSSIENHCSNWPVDGICENQEED